MRPRNIIPRESVYTQRADYLGVTNSLSRGKGGGGREERTGRKYADFLGRCGSPRDSRSFFFLFPFFPSLPLFHVQQAFTIEKATRRRAKRRWTIENRNFVFARKNKIPLLVFHGDREDGDHRFSAVEKFESQWGKLAFFTR